jgi:hypothetical protein
VIRRPANVEHAATSLALVPVLPRLPLRNRSTVGLLISAFRASHWGLILLARSQQSNGVSNFIGSDHFSEQA